MAFANFSLKVAAEVAAPLSQAKKVTMVSMGKGDVGAAKLTTEVLGVVEHIPKVVESLTGVNITKVYSPVFFCFQIRLGTKLCIKLCLNMTDLTLLI